MNEDRDDPVFDVFLEEVVGGCRPPDLTARIMQAADGAQARRDALTNGNGHAGSRQAPPMHEPAAPPIGNGSRSTNNNGSAPAPVSVRSRRRRTSRSKQHLAWAAVVTATCAVAAVITVAMLASYSVVPGDNQPTTAASPERDRPSDDAAPSSVAEKPRRPNRVGASRLNNKPTHSAPRRPATDVADHPPAFVNEPGGNDLAAPPVVDAPPRNVVSAATDDTVVAFIDDALQQSWSEHEATPSEMATDAEWCRRAYLRIVGRIPTVEELNLFLADAAPERRDSLVDRLTASEDFSRHWSFLLTNLLIGRSGGTREGEVASREDLQRYLRDSLQNNVPYDQLVAELISATGSNRNGSDQYNAATNFLLANQSGRATLATARTSQVFLGQKLQCVQCHNHHANDWAQNLFWQMNAFFRQMRVEQAGDAVKLVNRDFYGESKEGDADVYYEQIDGQLKVAYPAFDEPAVPRSGLLADGDLRRELARKISESDQLSRALVNRLWGHFFGYGFTRPVDDMGPHNAPTHPALLDELAGQFAAHDHDLKRLVRWIALSRAFGLSSKIAGDGKTDAPEYGGQPLFSRYYTRQLQPEEVYQSLLVASENHKQGNFGQQEEAKLAWLGQFTRDMGTDEAGEISAFDGAISQSLVMMNGPLTRRVISKEDGSMLDRLSKSALPPGKKVEHLFLTALARQPNRQEQKLAESLLAESKSDPAEALQTIWWALLNSNEFILDH